MFNLELNSTDLCLEHALSCFRFIFQREGGQRQSPVETQPRAEAVAREGLGAQGTDRDTEGGRSSVPQAKGGQVHGFILFSHVEVKEEASRREQASTSDVTEPAQVRETRQPVVCVNVAVTGGSR